MKYFLLFSLSIILMACGSSKEVVENPTPTPPTTPPPTSSQNDKPQNNRKVKSVLGSFEESDPFEIDEVRVEGNTLFLSVHYGGGCREHQFKMIGSPVVMKTLPAKRAIQLVHDNADDACKSIVNEVLEVDLKTLAVDQTPGSTVMLLLKGWEGEISFTFE